MRLRTRLAVTVLAVAIPVAGLTAWARHDLESRRVAQVLREFAVTRMESGGRERCEADPTRFPPPAEAPRDPMAPPLPPPPPEIGPVEAPEPRSADVRTTFWAYAADLTSVNPDAPAVPDELARAVEGEDVALRAVPGGHEVLVRMAWDTGPAAFVLVRRTGPDARDPADAWWSGALIAAAVLIAVLVASGPIVRRIRRLESEVRRSAEEQYGGGVTVDGDDEVARLARAFDEAAAQVRGRLEDVRRREDTLRSYVANTTHDIMTPLTVLAGHLDALRRRADGDEDAERTLAEAVAEVDYTTSLVANLATSAKLESGEKGVSHHAVDVVAMVDRIAARYRAVARARSIELNHAVPDERILTLGDVTLLEQAVGNVVQNAVRYTPKGGHVAVVLRSDADDRFEIRVVDDGPGLSDDDMARLTRRGFRGSAARTRGASGSGLGLDITRGVCGRLGLELRFERPEHGGLTVTFRGLRTG